MQDSKAFEIGKIQSQPVRKGLLMQNHVEGKVLKEIGILLLIRHDVILYENYSFRFSHYSSIVLSTHSRRFKPVNSGLSFARTAFWLTYVSWVLIQIWIGRRDHRPRSGDVRDRGSRLAIIAGISIGALAAFYFAKAFGGPGIGAPRLMALSGLALAWMGLALHLWSIQTLGKFFRTIVVLQPQHRLVTTGPYQFFRHPSYFSAVVTLIGLGLILNNWISLTLIVLIPLPGFLWRIHVEEQALYQRFGTEFLKYRQKRWALLPPIW